MQTEQRGHRVWAEIDLDHLVHNYQVACSLAPKSEVLCVIKADAYGHGAVPVARALAKAGATRFGVATPEEALRLRRAGISQRILLLDIVDPAWVPQMAGSDIAMAVGDVDTAKAYTRALGDGELTVHIKLNTGMNRLGLDEEAAVEAVLAIASLPGFKVEGLFTHLASADEAEENDFTRRQVESFERTKKALAARGWQVPLNHCANSGGTIAHPGAHGSLVRPGIMLYGGNPCKGQGLDLRPPLSLRTRVVQLHWVPKGQSVSYGRTWYAPRDSHIATLSIGYADGLPRVASGGLEMLVGGKRAPQVGRICMDMCMLDVTGLPGVAVGDTATVIGRDGEECITAEEVAAAAGTISYEVLCAIGLRVPRLYWQGGTKTQEICYLDRL